MKIPLFSVLLCTHSLLQADDFSTFFMSATLFILLFTLIIALMLHLKNLQKKNLRYSAFFYHSHIPALFIDAKSTIRDLNESAQTLMGYTKAQLINQVWYEKLLPKESSLQIRQRLLQEKNRDEKSEFNAPLINANGDIAETLFTLTKFPAPLKGFILTLPDSSKR
jgi:PAS domain S-box-containing protein